MHLMVFVLAAVAVLLALDGGAELFSVRKDPAQVRNRLLKLATKVGSTAPDPGESILRRTGRSRLHELLALELLLYRAGSLVTVRGFFALSAAFATLGFVGVFVFTQDPYRALPGLFVGSLPLLWIRSAARKRMRTFDAQLPSGLELVTRSMRSGHSLIAGFQMVGEELADPIGTEFGVVAEEVRLGLELRDALANMMRRIDNENLPYLTTAVLIQRQTGGNLAELLDRLSALLRERIQFSGRVRALTAQGRGAATFLACWMPAIMTLVWILAPDYLRPLVENRWGHVTLAVAFALNGLAYVLALRIADVEA
ncbi:MAG TPA: type II secretion system F family protein [Myxococcota bacterium]|nr:type II secretion system F family protein [Myxococcota bacterium]